ncbi:DUF3592 domain-containing protein [Nocardioides mangrovi]|uniref:DUF3592 domain-containing protein n=1 Tax=Nocardioides mangrovi TaxID=2874580 RepID=A0ABS7UKF6_9ACTN|nr:DUF3592 domain-containing protein [Nocardioides mangrovi]MBZ5741359.1 DUF3592 domain-containing protein [Nocardioides mangrovi]
MPTVLLLGAAVLVLLVALVLLVKGRSVRRSAASFRDRAVTATATVVGLEAKDLSLGAEPDTRYFPRVSYVPAGAAEPVEAQTLTDVPAPPPRVGDTLEVAYDPEHHDRVDVLATEDRVEGAGRTWFVLASLTALVAVGIAAAWLLLVFIVWTS